MIFYLYRLVGEDMKNKKMYIVMVVLFVAVFLVIYLSFYRTFLTGQIYIDLIPKQPMNSIKGIEEDPTAYVYREDKSYGNYIYLTNQFPISDEIGKSLEGAYKTFDFKFEFNEKTLGVDYVVTLERMKETDLEPSWVKLYLENERVGVKNCFRDTGRIKNYDEYSKYNKKDDEVILYKSKVTETDIKKGYRSFRFRMWVSEDVKLQNEDYLSKTFVARVNVHVSGVI